VDAADTPLYTGSYFQPAINAYADARRNYPANAVDEPRECEVYIGCGILIKRALFDAVGGFDGAGLLACTQQREGLRRLSAERVRQELVRLLIAPLRRVPWLLIPGGCAVGFVANIAVVNLGVTTVFSAAAPRGTYFVRMTSLSACGPSAPGPTVTVIVP